MLTDSSFHRRSNSQGLMNPAEIVVHVEQSYRVNMIVDLLAESVCQSRESAHVHTHGEILALDETSRDVLRIGRANDFYALCAKTLCGAVSLVPFRVVTVDLHQLRVIDLVRKRIRDGAQIHFVAVRCDLDAIRHPRCHVLKERASKPGVPVSNHPTKNKLRICVNCHKRPDIADNPIPLKLFQCDVLSLQPTNDQISSI